MAFVKTKKRNTERGEQVSYQLVEAYRMDRSGSVYCCTWVNI